MKKFLLSLFLFSVILSNAQFIENFSYTSTGTPAIDSLTNPSVVPSLRWKQHSGTSGQILMTSPGLSYTGYSGSNIGNAATVTHGSGSRQDVNAAVGPYTVDSVYCSFLVTPLAGGGTTGEYFLSFGATTGSSISDLKGRVFIKDGSSANTCNIGISKAGAHAAAAYSVDIPLNVTSLVVLKYKFVAGTLNDVLTAYIFAAGVPTTEPSSPVLTAPDNTTGTDIGITGISSICLRQGSNGTGSVIVDGIRVHDSWNNAPLPVKLSSFNAIGLQNQVNLNWATASEINSQSFEIERSIDGVNFASVATVKAKGVSGRSSTYQTVDRNLPASSVLYYRIKSVSIGGGFEYSPVQRVSLRNVNLSISPNPASNLLYINASSLIQNVELVDLMGKRVFTTQSNKTNTVSVDVSKLPNGNYALKTTVDGVSRVQKIVVSH